LEDEKKIKGKEEKFINFLSVSIFEGG